MRNRATVAGVILVALTFLRDLLSLAADLLQVFNNAQIRVPSFALNFTFFNSPILRIITLFAGGVLIIVGIRSGRRDEETRAAERVASLITLTIRPTHEQGLSLLADLLTQFSEQHPSPKAAGWVALTAYRYFREEFDARANRILLDTHDDDLKRYEHLFKEHLSRLFQLTSELAQLIDVLEDKSLPRTPVFHSWVNSLGTMTILLEDRIGKDLVDKANTLAERSFRFIMAIR